ncbi:hypothetical protein KC316_g14774, partial [Hortaea werneckii]
MRSTLLFGVAAFFLAGQAEVTGGKDTGATRFSKCISDSNVRSSDHYPDRNVYGDCLLGW